MKVEFSRQISKKSQISNGIKIRPLETKFFHADRRKEVTKLIVVFRSFVTCLKKTF